jgi:hypothetical protein
MLLKAFDFPVEAGRSQYSNNTLKIWLDLEGIIKKQKLLALEAFNSNNSRFFRIIEVLTLIILRFLELDISLFQI